MIGMRAMREQRSVLKLARYALFSPRQAAQESKNEENFKPALLIYLLFLIGYILFFWLKPLDFPDTGARVGENGGLLFWLKVMFWQPPLEAAWIVFLTGFVVWFAQ